MTAHSAAPGAFEAVIGLEVHAQLLTATKLFCGCPTTFGAAPNSQVCPICLGHPGVLPVLNRRAVELAARLGLAVGARVATRSLFARKNYFYPDLPKGYQVSQFEAPVCVGGQLEVDVDGAPFTAALRRAHLEEDAGKLLHDTGSAATSWVDFNRAGTPLLEIVTEPCLRSSAQAVAYLKALRALLMALDVCDGNLQEGSFRCDANVSVRRVGSVELGTRTELKNLNSFRFIAQALELEVARQIDVVTAGGQVVQETRLYDEAARLTRPMRAKEESHDYRYFPDPDLLPLVIEPAWLAAVQRELPELPRARALRYQRDHGLGLHEAALLVEEKAVARYFEAALVVCPGNPKGVANWVVNEVLRLVKELPQGIAACAVTPVALGRLVALLDGGRITGKIAKELFAALAAGAGDDPEALVQARGLGVVSDAGELERLVDAALAANPKNVASYRAGKVQLLGYFVGQVMKASRGQADPQALNALLQRKLGTP